MKQRKEFEKHHGIKMVKTFIEIGATLQVNISAAEREKIEAEVQLEGDMIRPDLFDDAQQQVRQTAKINANPSLAGLRARQAASPRSNFILTIAPLH